jgi:predicted transcriptional regulator
MLERIESIKMILGDMGIKILKALHLGPMDVKSINFLSGVPIACVRGRIPVLKSLNLIKEVGNAWTLDREGEAFLRAIGGATVD